MTPINLLPWRTIRRERDRKIWLVSLLLGWAMALSTVLLLNHHWVIRKHQQWQRRQRFLHDIHAVDLKIKEGLILRSSCRRYQEKIRAIHLLQKNRIKTIRLLNEMAWALPSGIYLTELTRIGNKVTLLGHAQSHQEVSQLMLGMEGLMGGGHPTLTDIKRAPNGISEQEFSLSFNA